MNVAIDFDKMLGLAPAIVQDVATGEVLMLGFMNRAAYEKTLQTGYVTFFSRTRNELWTKGRDLGKSPQSDHCGGRLRPRHDPLPSPGRRPGSGLPHWDTHLLQHGAANRFW